MKGTKKTVLSSFVTAFKAGLHAEHCRNTRYLLGAGGGNPLGTQSLRGEMAS